MAVSTRPSHYQSHDHRTSGSHRMAIDSLLNPSVESETTHTQLYSPSSDRPQLSPHFPPSPSQYHHQYYYRQYRDYHHHHHDINGATHRNDQQFLNYQPGSPHSSPDYYSSRDRHGSVSSTSSTNAADRRRPPRPKYEEEEMYFIWYHRVDLGQEWKEVRECFNRQFPNRPREGFQGIQCKFYRFIKEKKCPTVREQRRMRDGEFLQGSQRDRSAPRFGVVEQVGVWYPWMREDKEQVLRRKST